MTFRPCPGADRPAIYVVSGQVPGDGSTNPVGLVGAPTVAVGSVKVDWFVVCSALSGDLTDGLIISAPELVPALGSDASWSGAVGGQVKVGGIKAGISAGTTLTLDCQFATSTADPVNVDGWLIVTPVTPS